MKKVTVNANDSNAIFRELEPLLVTAVSTPAFQLCKSGKSKGKEKMCGYVHVEGSPRLYTAWGKYPKGDTKHPATTWQKGDQLVMLTLEFVDDKSLIYQIEG